MRPHEEEWRREETPYGKGTRVVVRDERGRTVAEFPAFDPTARDARWRNAELAQAAPNMARALLAFLPGNGHTLECGNVTGDDAQCSDECRNGRAALRKAGVIP